MKMVVKVKTSSKPQVGEDLLVPLVEVGCVYSLHLLKLFFVADLTALLQALFTLSVCHRQLFRYSNQLMHFSFSQDLGGFLSRFKEGEKRRLLEQDAKEMFRVQFAALEAEGVGEGPGCPMVPLDISSLGSEDRRSLPRWIVTPK